MVQYARRCTSGFKSLCIIPLKCRCSRPETQSTIHVHATCSLTSPFPLIIDGDSLTARLPPVISSTRVQKSSGASIPYSRTDSK